MILQEHQSLFDSIIACACATDEDKPKAEAVLAEWWSPTLVKNLDKRGVEAELITSLVQHIEGK